MTMLVPNQNARATSLARRARILAGISVFALAGMSPSALFAALPLAGAQLADLGTPAPLPNAQATPADVAAKIQQANEAVKRGDYPVAVLLLKNALQVVPKNGNLRAELGGLLLREGDAPGAEREFRQARSDGATDQNTLPGLFQAMFARDKYRDLLDQFPEPKAGDNIDTATTILRARAIAYGKLGQTAQSTAAIAKALMLRRDTPSLLVQAQLVQGQGDTAQAIKLTDEALKAAPTDSGALMMKIGLLEQAGQDQQALTYADQLVQARPEEDLPKVERVGILIRLNQDAKAKAEVDALLTKTPKLAIGSYYRALLRARAKDVKGAWEIAQTLPPEFVRSQPQIGLGVAEIAIESGNLETASIALSAIVNNFPKDTEARVRLAGLRLQQKQPQQALDTLLPLKDGNDPRAMALLGQSYSELRQYGPATEYFEKANAGGRGNDAVKTQLALSELRAGKVDQSIQALVDLNKRNPGNAGSAGPLIAALIQAGRFDEALAVADSLTKSLPKSPLGPFYRGEILLGQGSLDAALTSFGTALQTDPNFEPAHFYRAQVLVSQGNFAAANGELDMILARDANNISALMKKAEIATDTGQDAAVTPLLQRAVAAAPKDVTANIALINHYIAVKKYPEAETAATQVLHADPENAQALAALGQIQSARGARDQAATTFRHLATSLPQSAPAQVLLADSLVASKDSNGATTAYERAIQIDPDSLLARNSFIGYAVASGDANRALSVARDYAAKHPGTEGDLLVGSTLGRLKRFAEAKAVFAKSQAAHPDPRTVIALSQATTLAGDRNGAGVVLAGWLKAHPRDVAVLMEYGNLLLQGGNEAGARAEFEAVLKLQPYNAPALNNVAWVTQKSDPARAMKLITQAAKISPRSGEILDTLAWMKWQQNDRKDVLPLLQRAHDLSPNPDITYHLAVALEGAGQRDEAKKTLTTLIASGAQFSELDQAKKLAAQWH